jgi:predicted nucleotidyltransferase
MAIRTPIHETVLRQVVRDVVRAVHPLRILVFGSVARAQARNDSDLDLLVVVRDGTPRLATAQRLHRALGPVPVALDFLVATPRDLERHRDNPGLAYRAILREGRLVYAA